jgi:hypothetical protein
MKKDLVTETATPEEAPFITICELATQHGKIFVLEALNLLAQSDAEDANLCTACREEEEWFHFELSHLLERHFFEFQLPEPPEHGVYQRGVEV